MKSLEIFLERTLFATRWLLAPMFLGLAVALLALGVKFFQELLHIFLHIIDIPEASLVLSILSLIDMALVGSLIVMVMFSGYENFVSRLDIDNGSHNIDWLGKLDANTLKLKVAASIVAISSIHLLGKFMEAATIPNDKLLWYTIIHMAFVVSALLLGLLDKMVFQAHRGGH
jgi:uncharacterized protein (TIGR00645 family)